MKADESKKEQYIQRFQLSKLLEKSKTFSAAYLAYISHFHDALAVPTALQYIVQVLLKLCIVR